MSRHPSSSIQVATAGLPVEVDDPHTCCFATQEKAWTRDTDGVPWEIYTVVADTENFGASVRGGTPVDMILPPVPLDELQRALLDRDVVVVDAQRELGSHHRRVILNGSDPDCAGPEAIGTLLVRAGYTNVGRYSAGHEGWRAAGLPVESATQ